MQRTREVHIQIRGKQENFISCLCELKQGYPFLVSHVALKTYQHEEIKAVNACVHVLIDAGVPKPSGEWLTPCGREIIRQSLISYSGAIGRLFRVIKRYAPINLTLLL